MTEYKKLCALVVQLRDVVDLVTKAYEAASCDGDEMEQDHPDPVLLHTWASSIQEFISNGHPRLLKLLRKAMETDPNRQIYNEMMCERIKQLFEEFCACTSVLFGSDLREALLVDDEVNLEECAPLAWVTDVHDAYMLRLAETESWKKRLASDISDVMRFAEETRLVCAAAEKQARHALVHDKRRDKAVVQQLLDAQEAARWCAELRRRAAEHDELLAAAARLPRCRIPITGDGREGHLLEGLTPPFRQRLAASVRGLVRALRATPENPNIRRIRCNNVRVMAEYGHRALCHGCDICRATVAAAEALWYGIGYRVEYATPTAPPLPALLAAHTELCLPCGRVAVGHRVERIGYEDNAERLFCLHEPDPEREPTAWVEWYNVLEAMEHNLEDAAA